MEWLERRFIYHIRVLSFWIFFTRIYDIRPSVRPPLIRPSVSAFYPNPFSVWCQWANMIIRVDKCSSFGIKKHSSKSIQYQPKLFVNNQLVPRIEMGKSFCYLGRYFNFNMSDERHKSELCDLFNDIMSKIDELPLHPRNKILLYSRYLLSKISWELTVTDISKTWICETLDTLASRYIRKWLELPISATLSNVFLPETNLV